MVKCLSVLPPLKTKLLSLLVQGAVADVDDRPWNVGERSEKIGHQSLPEGIGLDDCPEKEVSVHLVSVSAPDDRIVIFSCRIGIAIYIAMVIDKRERLFRLN
jgi:hypothetical protein